MDTTGHKSTDSFKFVGEWAPQAKALREKFPSLTESDLKLEVGKEAELLKRVETRLNKNSQEVQNIIRKGQPAGN